MVENTIKTIQGLSDKVSNVSSSEASQIEKALYDLKYTNFRRLESIKKLYPLKSKEKNMKAYSYKINQYLRFVIMVDADGIKIVDFVDIRKI